MAETDKAAAEAFERDEDAVGRAAQQHLSDAMGRAGYGPSIAWERMPASMQESLISAGRESYRLGFAAGHEFGFEEGHETGYEAGSEAGYERCAEERDAEAEANHAD